MSDVARRAGVSVSTVSHVLNKTRPVASATVRSVLDAVADTGYVPDPVARALDSTGP
jgi:LacI family transcriptional regulator